MAVGDFYVFYCMVFDGFKGMGIWLLMGAQYT